MVVARAHKGIEAEERVFDFARRYGGLDGGGDIGVDAGETFAEEPDGDVGRVQVWIGSDEVNGAQDVEDAHGGEVVAEVHEIADELEDGAVAFFQVYGADGARENVPHAARVNGEDGPAGCDYIEHPGTAAVKVERAVIEESDGDGTGGRVGRAQQKACIAYVGFGEPEAVGDASAVCGGIGDPPGIEIAMPARGKYAILEPGGSVFGGEARRGDFVFGKITVKGADGGRVVEENLARTRAV